MVDKRYLNEFLLMSCDSGDINMVRKCLELGADVNLTVDDNYDRNNRDDKTFHFETPLIVATIKGHTEIVAMLLKMGADPKWSAGSYWGDEELARVNDALFFAILNKNIEIASMLIKKGADVNITYMDGLTPLIHAVKIESEELVKIMFDYGADVNYSKKNNCDSPLIEACFKNNTKIAKMLLDKGADINAREIEEDLTPLHVAAIGKNNLELVKLFIGKGINVNERTNEGVTVLMMASVYGNIDIIKLLINRGADINAKNKYGDTALMKACSNVRKHTVLLLLENGADWDAKNRYGDTVHMIATLEGDTEIAALIKNHVKKMVELIVNNGRTICGKPLQEKAQTDTTSHIMKFLMT